MKKLRNLAAAFILCAAVFFAHGCGLFGEGNAAALTFKELCGERTEGEKNNEFETNVTIDF